MKEAIKLMAAGGLTIKEISEKLGFDSVQYFHRQFKKIIHMTPSEYIHSIQISNLINPLDIL